jgi:hypothetical protein
MQSLLHFIRTPGDLLMLSALPVSPVPFFGDAPDRFAHIKAAIRHRVCINARF